MFKPVIEQQLPRLLSQACRDVNSPFYGCFDRNWWHYRIRDFASVMLQQGGYTAYLASGLDSNHSYREELKTLARGAALFWNERAKKKGAFEEYYPREQGYPPLAFSTLAIAKLVLEGVVGAGEIGSGLKKASRQLQGRFEYQAGNQQVAGLAALAALRKIDHGMVNEAKYARLKERSLALQDREGWYTEYDGPDLGYLSVTLDCLWDLYDFTGDTDYLDSAAKALGFMHGFISRFRRGPGMHNARNTDYIVPYGICRFLDHDSPELRDKSMRILALVFDRLDDRTHFVHAIDDRYWSHYIGHSFVRAQLLLKTKEALKTVQPGAESVPAEFPAAGYVFRKLDRGGTLLLVSAKKGGIFTVYDESGILLSDYGWVAVKGKKQFVNHWWSKDWELVQDENQVAIKGRLYPHVEKTSTPFMHFGLRVLSFLMGRSLTGILRSVLIFKAKPSGILFTRTIRTGSDELAVTDTFEGSGLDMQILRAPRASKRHVASADSWHTEDFRPAEKAESMERREIKDGCVVIHTSVKL